jgi:hypothetical protein
MAFIGDGAYVLTMTHDIDDDLSTAQTAESLLQVRGLRSDIFPSEIFDEHAWNMMLRLFVAQAKGDAVSEADLITLTGTPSAVGQRWLAHLVADEQVAPYADGDPVALTQPALDRMDRFLRMASGIHQSDGPA